MNITSGKCKLKWDENGKLVDFAASSKEEYVGFVPFKLCVAGESEGQFSELTSRQLPAFRTVSLGGKREKRGRDPLFLFPRRTETARRNGNIPRRGYGRIRLPFAPFQRKRARDRRQRLFFRLFKRHGRDHRRERAAPSRALVRSGVARGSAPSVAVCAGIGTDVRFLTFYEQEFRALLARGLHHGEIFSFPVSGRYAEKENMVYKRRMRGQLEYRAGTRGGVRRAEGGLVSGKPPYFQRRISAPRSFCGRESGTKRPPCCSARLRAV